MKMKIHFNVQLCKNKIEYQNLFNKSMNESE
jgi:hypothetical protein